MTAGLVARLPIMRALEKTTLGLATVTCRFHKPVFLGDTVRVDLEILSKQEGKKGDRGTIEMQRSVRNQRNELVIQGVWTLAVLRHPPLVPVMNV